MSPHKTLYEFELDRSATVRHVSEHARGIIADWLEAGEITRSERDVLLDFADDLVAKLASLPERDTL